MKLMAILPKGRYPGLGSGEKTGSAAWECLSDKEMEAP